MLLSEVEYKKAVKDAKRNHNAATVVAARMNDAMREKNFKCFGKTWNNSINKRPEGNNNNLGVDLLYNSCKENFIDSEGKTDARKQFM